jgi:hypothetical protein
LHDLVTITAMRRLHSLIQTDQTIPSDEEQPPIMVLLGL